MRTPIRLFVLVSCALLATADLTLETADAQRRQARRTSRADKARNNDARQNPANQNRARSQRGRDGAGNLRRGPEGHAKALRQRAHRIARTAKKGKESYLRGEFQKEMKSLLGELKKVQKEGKLDAVTEYRLMATAGRALETARRVNPEAVSKKQRNTFAKLFSNATYRRRKGEHETSLEIEAGMNDRILGAITTKDGTVGPVLEEGGSEPPAFLEKMAGDGGVSEIKWDSLSSKQKLKLLRSQTKNLTERDFFRDRSIPGVVFRKEIAKPLGKSVEVGGQKAKRRAKKVNVEDVLMRKVEHLGPTTLKDVSGVEFHVRQPARASKNVKDAWKVSDLLGHKRHYAHQHVPNKVPRTVRRGNSVDRAALVDFYRRANMALELRATLDGSVLKPKKKDNIVFFDYLKGKGLGRLNQHLHGLASRKSGVLRDSELKMGAVGFRKGELYGNKNMFGFEIRIVTPRLKEMNLFTDAVQKGVLTHHYGLDRSKMRRWHEKNVGKEGGDTRANLKKESSALAALHYNRPVRKLLESMPSELESHVDGKTREKLKNLAGENYGLKMLIHDFARDPALQGSEKADARARVLEAQKNGLSALKRGESPANVARQFARESKLYDVYAESIGMRNPQLQER